MMRLSVIRPSLGNGGRIPLLAVTEAYGIVPVKEMV